MKKLFLSILFVLPLVFVACEKEDGVNYTSVQINMNMPTSIEGNNPTLQNTTLTLTNSNTGLKAEKILNTTAIPPFDVEDGLYSVLVEGEVQYATLDADTIMVTKTETVRANYENLKVVGGKVDIVIDLFLYKESSGFVISEIFFTGTDKLYLRDLYIEIYNNTSEVLYADGLCIADTKFKTTSLLSELNPNKKDVYVTVAQVYKVPGSGAEFAIQPGEAFVLCDQGIDHKTENSNSFIDLSGAKFEWFDDGAYDRDVPEVQNLIKVVASTNTNWSLHNKGYTSYVLFKMDDVTPEQFASEYAYTYDYVNYVGEVSFPMSGEAWKVPNDKIIDAVECSTPSKFKWKALDPSLDLSWTHSGDSDDSRYGKSVKRKVSGIEGDRKILLDTNDSKTDFIPTANPSPGVIE